MIPRLLCLITLVSAAMASSLPDNLPAISKVTVGYAAFCRPSIIGELQIIGQPRRLSKAEAEKLGAIFGAKSTYYEELEGEDIYHRSFCMPHWDFKFVLMHPEHSLVAIRLCSSCQQLSVQIDRKDVDAPDMLLPAFKQLVPLLDDWFPGWAKATAKNKRKWERQLRMQWVEKSN